MTGLLIVLVANALAQAPAPGTSKGPCEARYDTAKKTVTVGSADDQRPCLLYVTPQVAPRTRTRLLFDSIGRHQEIEWDPLLSTHMSKAIVIPKSMVGKEWHVSMWSEPLQFSQRTTGVAGGAAATAQTTPIDLAWAIDDKNPGTTSGPRFVAVNPAGQAGAYSVDLPVIVLFEGESVDSTNISASNFTTSTALAGGEISPARALIAPSAAEDAAALLATTVLTRVKNGAFEATRDSLVSKVCPASRNAVSSSAASASTIKIGSFDLDISHTCGVVRTLRASTLATANATLVEAFEADLVSSLVEWLNSMIEDTPHPLASTAEALMRLAVDVSTGRAKMPEDAQSVLVDIIGAAGKLNNEEAKLATSTLSLCRQVEGCDVAMLHNIVEHPEEYLPGSFTSAKSSKNVERFARLAVDLLEADARDDALDRLASLGELVGIASGWLDEKQKLDPQAMAQLAKAVGGRDLSGAIGAITKLANPGAVAPAEANTAQTRMLRLITSTADLSRSLQEIKESSADAETIRKEQAKVLEEYAQVNTDRSGRGGGWVVGIGSGFAFAPGFRFGGSSDSAGGDTSEAAAGDTSAEEDDGSGLGTIASLPVGISVDFVRPEKRGSVGFTAGVYPIDLGGAFAPSEEGLLVQDAEGSFTDWASVLSPNVHAGVTFGPRSTPLVLGGQFGYNVEAEQLYTGLWLGVEVPLFDLN